MKRKFDMRIFELETPGKYEEAKKTAIKIAELVHAAFEYRMPPIISNYQVYQRMKDPGYTIYCCTDDNVIVGVAFVSADNLIEHLSVIPWKQGKGIGKALLQTVILRNVMKAGDKLTLIVKKRNKAAVSLYESHGFKVIDEKGPAAVIMERKI
jgi:ribosomal protein S18 acetylase RimI-like enzyme